MRRINRNLRGRGQQALVRKSLAQQVAALFSSGEQGIWLDPSDFSTMFQDSAGTTPVTAVEQPVGLILDKSGRGNHASQATSTSRPTLSARYNLLTKTEDFSDAAWNKAQVSVDTNQATAPDGTLTADFIAETAVTNSHFFRYVVTGLSGGVNVQCTGKIRVKANGRNKLQVLVERIGSSQWAGVTFNLSNNTYNVTAITAGSASFVSASIADDSEGFKLLTVTATPATGSNFDGMLCCLLNDAASETTVAPSYAGDNTKGFYVWGASLVPTSQASLPYQRVNTATDYDADLTIFKPYLKFYGVDDSLATAAINFTATDKMTVWAGVTKSSNVVGIVIELSTTVATNNGSFYISTGSDPTVNGYTSVARGTTAVAISQSALTSLYAASDTAVITVTHDIAGDLSTMRRNAVAGTNGTGDKGTGNFGNYALYIGSRGGSSLSFNGNLYSVIIRGATSTAAQITSGEQYAASKSGVTL